MGRGVSELQRVEQLLYFFKDNVSILKDQQQFQFIFKFLEELFSLNKQYVIERMVSHTVNEVF